MAARVKTNGVAGVGGYCVIGSGIALSPIGVMVNFKPWIGTGSAKSLLSAIEAIAQGQQG
jgi:hypothetical protein